MLKRIVKWFKKRKEDKAIDLARKISFFYLEKFEKGGEAEDTVHAANAAIDRLGITKLEVKGNRYVITLIRPGILIGRRGETIDALKKYLQENLNPKASIHIYEDKVISYLQAQVPYEYQDDNWEEDVHEDHSCQEK